MIGILENERIFMREIVETDCIDVHKYASQEKVCQYQAWGPNTEKESKEFVENVIHDAQLEPRSRFVFAVIVKDSNEMIGSGEVIIRDNVNRIGEISYIIHPHFWAKGFATEVAELLVSYGFNELFLHRIIGTCDPRNGASAKVLGKVGMTKEGRMRENIWIKDEWRDSFLYSILKHEWQK